MGKRPDDEIDGCLRDGGMIVTASERAARSLTEKFHRARIAEGLTAWPSPEIKDWYRFVRNAWEGRGPDERLVLSEIQERSLWAGIIATAAPDAAQIEGARDRLARMAAEAHGLLCAYAPWFLNEKARIGWDQDAALFSVWLRAFDELCRSQKLISTARLPLEIAETIKADAEERPPLLLAGFDRTTPTQAALFAAWGNTTLLTPGEPTAQVSYFQAADSVQELAACALWCRQRLAVEPHSRLLIVTQEAPTRRGEIERAFLRYAAPDANARRPVSVIEFSLGVPLNQIALPRGAGLLLHWLEGPIEEHELDWLLSSGQTTETEEETIALTAFARALRRRGLERTRWTLADFLRQKPGVELPATWRARLEQARLRLADFSRRPQTPVAWAELVPRLLETAGWPGGRSLTSAEYQAYSRWQQSIDSCASLGFDSRRIEWKEFLTILDRLVAETLYAPESHDAPILIAGPAESAGLDADAVWFLGADEESWPGRGTTHPFLPIAVQRECGMPHASPKIDWDLAETTTRRLLRTAPDVHFSTAQQRDGVESRPSRLIVQLAGAPQSLPAELTAPAAPASCTVELLDTSRIAFAPGKAPGGASTLTAQSQCAFKGFATARLASKSWEPAEAGLTAPERGQLLHRVMHSVWDGPPQGIRTCDELTAIVNLPEFVAGHVRRVLQADLPARARECMPQRYLELEEQRLADLVTEWLRYESARLPFTVADTEQEATVSIDGLILHLRLDRVDRLIDNSLLVLDYKSGSVKPSAWELPRPDDVQLPLYAGYAIDSKEQIGGVAFATIRAGQRNRQITGCVRDAKATLFNGLNATSGLVKNKLTDEMLDAWRESIEKLALDFLSGRAVTDPRDYPKTCERCGLQVLCRIQENPPGLEDNDDSDEGEGSDA